MTRQPLISIILPTYNECGNIVSLINRLLETLSSEKLEIILVDDNSPDKTYQKAKQKYVNNSQVKLFLRKKDKGLAKAILYGLNKANGEILAIMDTDFNHAPEDLKKMIQALSKKDLVIGSRYIKGGGMQNRARFFFSLIYNLFIRLLLGLKTHDNLSGFFVIRRKSLNLLDLKIIFHGYGDYFIRLLYDAQKKKLKIMEIPVFYKDRFKGESKSRLLTMLMDYSKTVIEIKKQD